MDFAALLQQLLESEPVARGAYNAAGAAGGASQALGAAGGPGGVASRAAFNGLGAAGGLAQGAGGLAARGAGALGSAAGGLGTAVAGAPLPPQAKLAMAGLAALGAGGEMAHKAGIPGIWNAEMPLPGGLSNPINWAPAGFNAYGTAAHNATSGRAPWDTGAGALAPATGGLGSIASGIGSAVSSTGPGAQAAQAIDNATQGPSNAVRQVTGQPPVSNPGQVAGPGQGIPAENASVGQQRLERNQTVGRGGKAGMAELLQEKGMNPYFSGNMYAQSLMNNADALTLQSKLEGAMHPGTPAEQSFSDVAGRVLNNQGAYFDQPTAQRVYSSAAEQARKYQENPAAGATPELLAELLFGENSAPNVAQLLYGTSTGALGAAQQNSVLQQSERGRYMYRHPDQYSVPQNHLGFLDIYNNSLKR